MARERTARPEAAQPDGARDLRAGGALSIVATPIGNLGDITLRGIEVLRSARYVVAEDTRQTRKLLAALGIPAQVRSLHAHSTSAQLDWVLGRLAAGDDVAYVSDAGTPTLSDPGTELVDRAHRAGLPVRVVPGPSALTAAVAVAGLPCSTFRFLGFLPRSPARRRALLSQAAADGSAFVLYESPRRLAALLAELEAVVPERPVAVCRELTKVHEEVRRGPPGTLLRGLQDPVRGEVTVVVSAGLERRPLADQTDLSERVRELVEGGATTRAAARLLADELGLTKRQAYEAVLAARQDRG